MSARLEFDPVLACRVCGGPVRFSSADFVARRFAKLAVGPAFLDLCHPISVGVDEDGWLLHGHRSCLERFA